MGDMCDNCGSDLHGDIECPVRPMTYEVCAQPHPLSFNTWTTAWYSSFRKTVNFCNMPVKDFPDTDATTRIIGPGGAIFETTILDHILANLNHEHLHHLLFEMFDDKTCGELDKLCIWTKSQGGLGVPDF